MSRIVAEIADRVRQSVRDSAATLKNGSSELRIVFHGPPLKYLKEVYGALADDGGITVTLAGGGEAFFPVLLQVDRLADGCTNPAVGRSGECEESHLLVLRNTPACPRFVALLPPGRHRNLSVSSATFDCGVSALNNSGTATIESWWSDDFVQEIVDAALSPHSWPTEQQRQQARQLIEHALKAADVVDRHDAARPSAWDVLARVFSIPDTGGSFCATLCLACGFPPLENGTLCASEQLNVLDHIADALVNDGFKPGIDKLKTSAVASDAEALDGFLGHLLARCDVPTALGRAPSWYYGPSSGSQISATPAWWRHLTVEKWNDLLEQEKHSEGSLRIECTNSLIPLRNGVGALVESVAELRVILPAESPDPADVTVTREAGGAKNRFVWRLRPPDDADMTDVQVPTHRTPIRYSAAGDGLRNARIKVVSLQAWEPGVFVFCRTAAKLTPPRQVKSAKDGVGLECSLTLMGQGRHYIDLYVRQGVTVGEKAIGRDASEVVDEAMESPISLAGGDAAYGFDIIATAECHYDVPVDKGNGESCILRLHITSDETSPEGCKTEFDRLIRLNRQSEKGRATTDVQIDRQVRCADLQVWMLEPAAVENSFAPIVLAPDYASRWGPPGWGDDADTVLSKARFLHDPRPPSSTLAPPPEFVLARKELAERIRGADGNGLVESARLGVWLAGDVGFSETLERYVRSYNEWLEADPDSAAWVDLIFFAGLEADGKTLVQDPDAILLSPLHPLRLAWHALAQRALYLAYQRNAPCPAASVLDPDVVPDALSLPLRTATGSIRRQLFFSIECSSDYWSILWNASRLDRLASRAGHAPFDQEFGLTLGGVSSGFSVSQVQRALDDVWSMLAAKPVLNVVVAGAAGQSNACNEGLINWCTSRFASGDAAKVIDSLGPRLVQVFDNREPAARPEESSVSNLAEDTGNSIKWFAGLPSSAKPDLGIIAQLETSNAGSDPVDAGSPVGIGSLIRHRIRRQLTAGAGAFLSESRMGIARPPSGDGLADKVMHGVVRLENLGDSRCGYTFAPSVHAIEMILRTQQADYAAVSSTAVDPACFLGDWLESAYLWDYELPSYSHRAGDTNGYYLLSRVKDIDRDTLHKLLGRLPGCSAMTNETVDEIILEVARRGIPTVRGLSGGDSGASGDLGLFVASRLLQDEFRRSGEPRSLLPVAEPLGDVHYVCVLVPVDPFRGYLEDLHRGVSKGQALRPDLLVAGVVITDSSVRCKLTPVEVKFRGKEIMPATSCKEALQQARALSELLGALMDRASQPDMLVWKLGMQHLLLSMLSFGFRVYSQQARVARNPREWAGFHQRLAEAVLSEDLKLDIDPTGRLIVVDGSPTSTPKDVDGDGFRETIALSLRDAASIVKGDTDALYALIRGAVGDWALLPSTMRLADTREAQAPLPEQPKVRQAPITSPPHTPPDGESPSTGPAKASEPVTHNPLSQTTSTSGDAPQPIEVSQHERQGVALLVGETIEGFKPEKKSLHLSDTDLNQLNIGVVGDLGTGKTQLLKSLVYQITAATQANRGVRPRFLVFDYKKDYSAEDFVRATGARVITPQHLPINLFDTTGSGESLTPWLDRFRFFADVLDKLFPGIGPVQRSQLKQAVRQAYDECGAIGRQPTIYDVHAKYRATLGKKPDSPLSIIDDLVDMELFSREPTDAATTEQFLDGTVVIALNALGQDDKTKNMLVAIMLNMFYEHMLRIPKRPYVGDSPQLRVIDSFLLVDEADNIMRYEFDVLRKILLQGREFGVGVILASQYLRHFKAGATDYREPLLTWFIHKVPNVTPQELGALGLAADNLVSLAEQVKLLGKHECLYKTQGVGGTMIRGMPFYQLLASPGFSSS